MIGCYKSTIFVVFATVLTISSAAKADPLYSITELGSLGGNLTIPYGINASGVIVGVAQNSNGLYQSTLWQANSTVPINLGDGLAFSQALGINNKGIVVGSSNGNAAFWQPGSTIPNYLTTGGNSYAAGINSIGQIVGFDNGNPVLWQYGSTTAITLAGVHGGSAVGINNSGQIAGAVFSPTNGALWQSASATPLIMNTLGGTYSEANAINNLGQIVGYSEASGHVMLASLWQPGSSTPTALSSDTSDAFSINANGEIVGYITTGGTQHAALWSPNSAAPIDLNILVSISNSYLKYAYGINDTGQIVAESASGKAYLLTPASVPVPASIWLFGSTLLGLLSLKSRRA